MRNNMKMLQVEEGHIWPLGPISLPGTEMQRSQWGKRGKKDIKVEPGISRREEDGHQEQGIMHLIYGP